MSYDFALYVVEQVHPVNQRIRRRFQQETRDLSKTRADQEKERIVAEEASRFAEAITDGDLRMMDTVLSLIQMHYADYKEGIRAAWTKGATQSLTRSVEMGLFAEISAVRSRLDTILPTLPLYSWYISLPVRLVEPFTSKDDSEIHVLENPICRERVFGVPMVRPSTWKGNLRWTAVIAGLDQKVRERLFGNETDEEEEFHAGRLFFFPTYFNRIDFEVMTPLDRERRSPKPGPIFLECVYHHPGDGARAGDFGLLYLAPPGAWQSPAETAEQAVADLKYTAAILTDMLLSYGFSAKKASGFGVIEDNFRDQQGRKLGMLAVVGVVLPEVEGTTKSEPVEQLVTRLPFGSCAEMRYQAERVAQVLEEVTHE